MGLITVTTSSLRMGQGESGYWKLERPIAVERSWQMLCFGQMLLSDCDSKQTWTWKKIL